MSLVLQFKHKYVILSLCLLQLVCSTNHCFVSSSFLSGCSIISNSDIFPLIASLTLTSLIQILQILSLFHQYSYYGVLIALENICHLCPHMPYLPIFSGQCSDSQVGKDLLPIQDK